MKKFLLIVSILIIVYTSQFFPQWSTDPNNNLIVGYGLNPDLCSDSVGGCYITYEYGTTGYPRKLAVERLDRYGYKPWGDKIQILGEREQQWQAEIIEDGEGGVIISYEDNEVNFPYNTTRVRVQRVDSSGNFLWGQTGIRVSLSETNQGGQKIISDGSGGCIVAWMDTLSEYRINRIGNMGERLWGDSGKIIESNTNGYNLLLSKMSKNQFAFNYGRIIYGYNINGEVKYRDSVQYRLVDLTSDESGGIVASWYTGNINNIQIASQRKDSLGNNLWQEPYVVVGDSLIINSFLNIKYVNGYYYYNWTGNKNGVNMVSQLQGMRLDGSKLFSNVSIPISNYPVDALFAGISPSDSSTFVLIWEDFRSNEGVFGQKLDTLGNRLWDTNDVRLYEGAYADLFSITDGNGGAIGLGWHQFDFSIRVFKVSKNGIMGEVVIPVELISFTAKVINNSVELYWQTVSELNNMGFEVQKLKDYKIERFKDWEVIEFLEGNGTTTQTNTYSFIDNNINSGIYKYRLKQIDYDGSYEYSDEISVEVNFLPKEYLLYQNYPNPFNSSTIIKYYLPQEGRVKLNLYNILGEKLKTLYEGELEMGEHKLSLSSDELSSGIYFYTLETTAPKQIKKLTIIK